MNVLESKPLRGWWFGGDTLPHGDGRTVAVGTVHRVEPPIVACKHGLHCSRHSLDALYYACQCRVWRVEVWGECDSSESNKLAAEYRRYLWTLDAETVMRRFACRCALDVLPADAPSVVREYLRLADRATPAQRDAARGAAWDAARGAAWDAAWAAAQAAARAAARDAARAAAQAAARAAGDAAAEAAAGAAAEDAAWAAQSRRLDAMLAAAHRAQGGQEK